MSDIRELRDHYQWDLMLVDPGRGESIARYVKVLENEIKHLKEEVTYLRNTEAARIKAVEKAHEREDKAKRAIRDLELKIAAIRSIALNSALSMEVAVENLRNRINSP